MDQDGASLEGKGWGKRGELELESNNGQSDGNECYGKHGHSFSNDFEFLGLEEGASSGGFPKGSGGGRGWGRREQFVLQLFKESVLVFNYQINGWNVEVECRNVEVRMFDAKDFGGTRV